MRREEIKEMGIQIARRDHILARNEFDTRVIELIVFVRFIDSRRFWQHARRCSSSIRRPFVGDVAVSTPRVEGLAGVERIAAPLLDRGILYEDETR